MGVNGEAREGAKGSQMEIPGGASGRATELEFAETSEVRDEGGEGLLGGEGSQVEREAGDVGGQRKRT